MTIFYIDYVNGNDVSAGTSWGAAWKTFAGSNYKLSPNDVVRVAKSPNTTSLGQSALWTNQSLQILLTTAVTKNIDLCTAAWTASANVTTNVAGDSKIGASSSFFSIATGFTTGKIAYKALGGLTDFSAYQQVSFWIYTNGAIDAGVLTLNLCTDTIGAVSVNSIPIPSVPADSHWQAVTVNTGGNFSALIQSISLNAVSDPATPNFFINNLLACKASSAADSLTLSSLIAKNSLSQGGGEGFYAIKSINDTDVQLDMSSDSLVGVGRGYSGTTETVATYKREPILIDPVNFYNDTLGTITDSGTNGNNIQYQCGYNTSNSSQDGETYYSGQNNLGIGVYFNGASYVTLTHLNVSRFWNGIYLNNTSTNNNISGGGSNNYSSGIDLEGGSANNIINGTYCNNNDVAGVYTDSSSSNTYTISQCNSNGYGFAASNSNFLDVTVSECNNNSSLGVTMYNVFGSVVDAGDCNYNGSTGLDFSGVTGNIVSVENCNYNGYIGINFAFASSNIIKTIGNCEGNASNGLHIYGSENVSIEGSANFNNNVNDNVIWVESDFNGGGSRNPLHFRGVVTSGNQAGIRTDCATIYLDNCSIGESPLITRTNISDESLLDYKVYSNRHNQTAYSKIITDGGYIESQASTLSHGSGTEWKFTTADTTNRKIYYPLSLSIGKILVSANNLVTISCWFKKGHATDIGARLICKGGQISGVDNDVIAVKANDTSEEQLTITFTPTETRVVEIEAQCFYISGHSTVIVDGLAVTQA